MTRLALPLCLALASCVVAGCKSDEEKLLDKQDRMMSPATSDADAIMREGEMMKDRGMLMKNNGRAAEGERMIQEGQRRIDDAKEMKNRPATKPS